MSTTYTRTLDSKKRPVYKFTVSKGRSSRDLKVTFAHNNSNPIFLVNEQREPQLGWRVDFQDKGNYDFDSLPSTLQPLVHQAVNEILDHELESVRPKVREHNTVTDTAYETVCEAVPGLYDVEEVFAILGRSHALDFGAPLSVEALNIAYKSLKNFTDIERLEEANQESKEKQETIDELRENFEDATKRWKEYMVPSKDLEDGLDKLIRDLEAGWIVYDPGTTMEEKVLDRLNEIADLLLGISDFVPEDFE